MRYRFEEKPYKKKHLHSFYKRLTFGGHEGKTPYLDTGSGIGLYERRASKSRELGSVAVLIAKNPGSINRAIGELSQGWTPKRGEEKNEGAMLLGRYSRPALSTSRLISVPRAASEPSPNRAV